MASYPSPNDREWNLLKKIVENTASIAVAEAGDVASVTGTTNQITVSNPTGAVTLSLPSTLIAPGSFGAVGNITFGTAQSILSGTTGSQGITVTGTNQSFTITPSGTGQLVINSGAINFPGLHIKRSGTQLVNLYWDQTRGSAVLETQTGAPLDLNYNGAITRANKMLLGGLTTDGTGVLQFPAATTSAGGITFGADVNFFRTAAGAMQMNAQYLTMQAAGEVHVAFNDTALTSGSRYWRWVAGSGTIGSGIGLQLLNDAGSTVTGDYIVVTRTTTTLGSGSTGTVALTLDSSQNATFAGNILRFATTKGIVGTNTNDNAASTIVGEYISSTIASGSAVSLSNNTVANVTSISLTAGDWDVEGVVDYTATSATTTRFISGSSSTSATLGAQDSYISNPYISTALSTEPADNIPTVRYSLNATTTIYLVSRANFSAGTVVAYGTIRARRIR